MGRADILIGIDSGTSVVKAVAFDLAGRQLGVASIVNSYHSGPGGAATQDMDRTWQDCARALRDLGETIEGLAGRTAAIGVTAQGDGTWLIDRHGDPVGDAWLWLDARAAPTVRRLQAGSLNRARFEATGTGLNTCQQGSQLAHMQAHDPLRLDRAAKALHCKDWLYLKLTGEIATDPSEASFTFGDFRSRRYSDTVIGALGLGARRGLLPEIVEGTEVTHALSADAAQATGLLEGTPVSLGYVDMVMTALGAGVYTGDTDAACSTIGSTGVHMHARPADRVHLNAEGTGYVIALPVPDMVTQVQTNMAATLNIDWILGIAADVLGQMGQTVDTRELVGRIDGWLAASRPGTLLYHPYISEAGERGPFVDANARAGFAGLSAGTTYADLLRAVAEGLGMAARDCYAAMGALPAELRLTGGAARSSGLREVLAACIGAPVRVSERDEAGAAGAAMMAAVAIGAYPHMRACIDDWVTPLLGTAETPPAELVRTYDGLFPVFAGWRRSLTDTWDGLARQRAEEPVSPDLASTATTGA